MFGRKKASKTPKLQLPSYAISAIAKIGERQSMVFEDKEPLVASYDENELEALRNYYRSVVAIGYKVYFDLTGAFMPKGVAEQPLEDFYTLLDERQGRVDDEVGQYFDELRQRSKRLLEVPMAELGGSVRPGSDEFAQSLIMHSFFAFVEGFRVASAQIIASRTA